MDNKSKKESNVLKDSICELISNSERQHRSELIKRGIQASLLRKEAEKNKNKGHIIKKNKITRLEEKYTKFLTKYSKTELLIVLTIALSSKLILSNDAKIAVERMMTSKKALRSAFGLSESFLTFATQAFIRKDKEEYEGSTLE